MHGQLAIDLRNIPYYGILPMFMLVVHIFHPIPRHRLLTRLPPPPPSPAMVNFGMLLHYITSSHTYFIIFTPS